MSPVVRPSHVLIQVSSVPADRSPLEDAWMTLDESLPRVEAVKEACDSGRSVWSLPRRKPTIDFLSGVDTLAHQAWHRLGRHEQWPPMPPPGSTPLYVPGWSRDAE